MATIIVESGIYKMNLYQKLIAYFDVFIVKSRRLLRCRHNWFVTKWIIKDDPKRMYAVTLLCSKCLKAKSLE